MRGDRSESNDEDGFDVEGAKQKTALVGRIFGDILVCARSRLR